MQLKEIMTTLDGQLLCGGERLDEHAYRACASDLLSDVLVHVADQSLLLTGLCNPQVVRTAEMLDIICIIFVRGKTPDEQTLQMASEKNICVINTELTMFTACGRLYEAGIRGRV